MAKQRDVTVDKRSVERIRRRKNQDTDETTLSQVKSDASFQQWTLPMWVGLGRKKTEETDHKTEKRADMSAKRVSFLLLAGEEASNVEGRRHDGKLLDIEMLKNADDDRSWVANAGGVPKMIRFCGGE